MKKAIVFGANGYLGRHIAYFLNKKNIDFTPTDISNHSIDSYNNYKQVDITDSLQISKLDLNVDFIFVFSGLTGTNIGFEKYSEFIDINEKGLLNILNCHNKSKSNARIIFPSTRLVYKGKENVLLTENDEKEALTIYAQNKLTCENYLKIYQNYFKIDYTVFRICVPYGNLIDNNYSYGTLGFFLDKAKKGEDITLYGDGNQKRTFTHIEDLVNIILEAILLDTTKNNVYNIGSNDHLSLLDIAKPLAEKNGVKVKFLKWPNDTLKIESGDTIFDDSKLQKELNYNYKFSLKDDNY